MRAREFLKEHFDLGRQQIGNTTFDVKKHALDRLEERHIPPTTARELLRRVSLVSDKLRARLRPEENFWAYDDSLDISMGMVFKENGVLAWTTSLIGRPRHRPGEGRYPDFNINELDEDSVINELFKPGKNWEWSFRGSEEAVAKFQIGDVPYQFIAYTDIGNPGVWETEFKQAVKGGDRRTRFGLTGTGNSAEVMSTVVDILRNFLQEYHGNVNTLVFSAKESSRQSLYRKMLERLLPNWEITTDVIHGETQFVAKRPQEVDEEVLDETTEQDQILVHVATAATQRVLDLFNDKESNFLNAKIAFDPSIFLSRRDRLTWLSGIRLIDLHLPEVSDPEINRMLSRVKVKLTDNYSPKNANTLGAYITYEDGSRLIELYLPRLHDVAANEGHRTANMIRSTFIHEMQHALDDIKSQGKFDSPSMKKQSSAGTDDQRYRQYLKLPYEINARFTQAILDIAMQYNRIEGPYRLQDLITNAFKNHNLNVASKREYKHLATRAYKFFDAMQNSPKRVEPKSLAQRAIAWITSKPMSTIK